MTYYGLCQSNILLMAHSKKCDSTLRTSRNTESSSTGAETHTEAGGTPNSGTGRECSGSSEESVLRCAIRGFRAIEGTNSHLLLFPAIYFIRSTYFVALSG